MNRVLLVVAAVMLPCRSASAQDVERGRELYDRWCAGCHGEAGDGQGEAARYMLPPPRDFRRAVYQIRTTANGELPTDDDLRRVIDEGMPGTAMPGWRSRLGASDRDAVLAYVKTFSRFFDGTAPEPVDIGRAPGGGVDAVAEGRRVYEQLECFKCHGNQGRGDGQSAPTLVDDWDAPIRPADLTQRWRFNGGGSIEQIYTRLRTGLDGTPMPSFADAVDGGIITNDQLWNVAQYVHSLSGDGEPEVREVIRAVRSVTGLPAGPDDDAWGAARSYWVPLVGQIIVAPRWFTPTVAGVFVQAMHDDTTLVMRFSWSDPSRSPDPVWQEWRDRVAAFVTDADGPIGALHGPDRFHVQFPEVAGASEMPYFLGGSPRTPVTLWRWTSGDDVMAAGRAAGLGTFQADTAADALHHAAAWREGAWRLQVARALTPSDSTLGPRFAPGLTTSIAFFAADGSNGEDARRGAVSAWYALYLEVPSTAGVYVTPLIAALVTAGLGWLLIRRAQRDHRGAV